MQRCEAYTVKLVHDILVFNILIFKLFHYFFLGFDILKTKFLQSRYDFPEIIICLSKEISDSLHLVTFYQIDEHFWIRIFVRVQWYDAKVVDFAMS